MNEHKKSPTRVGLFVFLLFRLFRLSRKETFYIVKELYLDALTLHDAARLLALKRCTAVIGQAVVQRTPALVSVATKLGLLNLTEAYRIARASPANQVAMYFQSLRAATATTPESAAK